MASEWARDVERLIVGRRYEFYHWGEYDVLGQGAYTLTREDASAVQWPIYVVAGVAKPATAGRAGRAGRFNQRLLLLPALGLCFTVAADFSKRPRWATRYAPLCGETLSEHRHDGRLAIRADGRVVTSRSVMTSWLDNGAVRPLGRVFRGQSALWVHERFVETPPGEEAQYPAELFLCALPILRLRSS